MNLKKYITKDTIKVDLAGETPSEILREIVEVLRDAGKINPSDLEDAVTALKRREKMMSTGLERGIAIPHAKTKGVTELVGALGIKKRGVNFGSLDGNPSQIFVVTLSPKGVPVPHVLFLAEISKVLQNDDVREKLLSAKNADEVLKILFQ